MRRAILHLADAFCGAQCDADVCSVSVAAPWRGGAGAACSAAQFSASSPERGSRSAESRNTTTPSIPRVRVRTAVTGCASTWLCRRHEQEQQLQNDPAFRSLPPERQNQTARPPAQVQQPASGEEGADPEPDGDLRAHDAAAATAGAQTCFPAIAICRMIRRSKVSQAYRELRGMPPSAREQALNSDEYRNGFTDDERDLLRGMADLNVGPTR